MGNHKSTWNKVNWSFLKKGVTFMLLHLSRQFFIPPALRPLILKFCGVTFLKPKTVFIGTDVLFDNMKNAKTYIGENVWITTGVKIINHYPIISKKGISEFNVGSVIIEDNVFIGMNSLIIKPITIGRNSIIGAGSVVTKDIPEYSIVGGNPAKVIGSTITDTKA